MSKDNLQRWYDFVENHDQDALRDMLADNVVFHSPVVHTPQEGKAITFAYLASAGKVLGGDNFEYVGEYLSENGAVIEFITVIDGIKIDGIDMITWNDDGKITEFKVMLRPLKAVNKVHEMMGLMLQKMAK
ncbi:nuclear transport factor 2 family protein [Kordiimonas aquimaris]|uniref:nuclear transport factor 2 family protein n=1 Tax=Kordiimonas aquimaris TaxID=707591 RepID=UPI0021D1E3A9|nr:nuclear transport factor 2 family protein [Kordiimonas aquimaris]